MALQHLDLRPQLSRSSSLETAIWQPLAEVATPTLTNSIETRDRLAERNQQRVFPPRTLANRAKSPNTPNFSRPVRATSPRATNVVPPSAIRATSPRSTVSVPSVRLQQWRTAGRQPEDVPEAAGLREAMLTRLEEAKKSSQGALSPTREGAKEVAFSATTTVAPRDSRLEAQRTSQSPLSIVTSPTEDVKSPSREAKSSDLRFALSPTRQSLPRGRNSVVSSPRTDLFTVSRNERQEVSSETQLTREGGRSLRRASDVQAKTRVIERSGWQNSPIDQGAPLSSVEAAAMRRDSRSRPSIPPTPRAADARPNRSQNASLSPASRVARHPAPTPAGPRLATVPSLESLVMEPEAAHRRGASHGQVPVNPENVSSSPVKPPPNFSRPLRVAASVQHLTRQANEEPVVESPISDKTRAAPIPPLTRTDNEETVTNSPLPGNNRVVPTPPLIRKDNEETVAKSSLPDNNRVISTPPLTRMNNEEVVARSPLPSNDRVVPTPRLIRKVKKEKVAKSPSPNSSRVISTPPLARKDNEEAVTRSPGNNRTPPPIRKVKEEIVAKSPSPNSSRVILTPPLTRKDNEETVARSQLPGSNRVISTPPLTRQANEEVVVESPRSDNSRLAPTVSSGISGSIAPVAKPDHLASARASTKALIVVRTQELETLQHPGVARKVTTSSPKDEITSISPLTHTTSPPLARRGTHPPPTLNTRSNSETSSKSRGSYGTMNSAISETAQRNWQASTFDTSVLSAKEIAKLKKKGINPALYLEMKAARKGKGLSPLVGNSYIG